ncbi:MAG TPA: aquaporin [Ktedonosporobacter sp.]|jgi:glycerol uptake facilitator-like aquaporin|nr:aquaporin [Ktedonosporobacter sp.]
MTPVLLRRAGAECLGTCVLVVIANGAVLVNARTGLLVPVGGALLFGGSVVMLIALLGHRSSAHFNPAVTLLFALTRALFWRDVPLYVGSQFFGATCGALLLRMLWVSVPAIGMASLQSDPWIVLVLEMGLSTVLLLVVLLTATTTEEGEIIGPMGLLAALTIGTIIAFGSLLGSAFGGVFMNPALSLGPALAVSVWGERWVHFLGPLLAACAVAGLYWGLHMTGRHNLPDHKLVAALAQEQLLAESTALPLKGGTWVVVADRVCARAGTRRTFLTHHASGSRPSVSLPPGSRCILMGAATTTSGWLYLFSVKTRASRVVILIVFLRRI